MNNNIKVLERKYSGEDLVAELVHLQELCAPCISVGRQCNGIAHNLNSPLTGMLGHLELMKLRHAELHADIDVVIDLAQKMQQNIAILAHKYECETQRDRQLLDINEILQFELLFLNTDLYFKHNIEVVFLPQKPLPKIRGFYADLSLAFEEIVINAVDAQRQQKSGWLQIRTFSDDTHIFVEIKDRGPGFSAEALQHAFDPFWPEIAIYDDGSAHFGMGLFFSKRRLERYGGWIELENEEQNGARVLITLPLPQGDE